MDGNILLVALARNYKFREAKTNCFLTATSKNMDNFSCRKKETILSYAKLINYMEPDSKPGRTSTMKLFYKNG